MGDIPTTVNEPSRRVNQVIKGLLDIGFAGVETVLLGYAPWLGLPVVKQIFEWCAGKLEDQIYFALAEEGTYLVLKFQTKIEKTAYLASIEELKQAQDTGNADALAAARKKWADAASSFIHSDGAATP